MVSIPGGEPLLHPKMPEIVAGLVARKKYVYMCTNALLLKEKLHLFKPSKYLSFSVHVDGQREHHDFSVCREGWLRYRDGGGASSSCGWFPCHDQHDTLRWSRSELCSAHFDEMMEAGVESMMVSPGYTYDKAPDQNHFLGKAKSRRMFRAILSNRKKEWRFNTHPLFSEFLMGKQNFECTPWGMPTFSIFGWQKPCYLLQDGYADSFQELLDTTNWENYGAKSGNPQCANCMVHSGHEASAVDYNFSSLKGFFVTAKKYVFASLYPDAGAEKLLNEWRPEHTNPLVQIQASAGTAKTELQAISGD